MNSVPLPVGTIRNAFNELKQMVDLDLNIQQGDAARLNDRAQHCISLLALVNQHANLFDHEERATITSSLDNMISHLEDAAHRLADPPNAPFFPTTLITRTGKPGRPRIDIDPNLLSVAYELRGPAHLADVFGVHPRTVRRCILEQGLAEPGEPVYIDYEQPDGTIAGVYRSSTGASSSITDDELDATVLYILEAFPGFGRHMIDGHLKFLGHHIPRSRIEASYTRVHGAPATGYGPRRIEYCVYKIPGPNSLWHHNGQHGLIQWKFVIHGFIDGFSRFVVAIQVSSNNTACTVLDVFIDAIKTHGIPSRVHADYGTENLLVAALMESLKGLEHGSYIWGRSVHNVRIERPWRDITLGFGQKWKQFFEHLEVQMLTHTVLQVYDADQWGKSISTVDKSKQGFKIGMALDFGDYVMAFLTMDNLFRLLKPFARQQELLLEIGVYTISEIMHRAGLLPILTEKEVFDDPSRFARLIKAFYCHAARAHEEVWALVKPFLRSNFFIAVQNEDRLLYTKWLAVHGKDQTWISKRLHIQYKDLLAWLAKASQLLEPLIRSKDNGFFDLVEPTLLQAGLEKDTNLGGLIFGPDTWASLGGKVWEDDPLRAYFERRGIETTKPRYLHSSMASFTPLYLPAKSLQGSWVEPSLYYTSDKPLWSIVPQLPSNTFPAGFSTETCKGKHKAKGPPQVSPAPREEKQRQLFEYIVNFTIDYANDPQVDSYICDRLEQGICRRQHIQKGKQKVANPKAFKRNKEVEEENLPPTEPNPAKRRRLSADKRLALGLLVQETTMKTHESPHICGLVIDLGGAPNRDRIGFRYWRNPGAIARAGLVDNIHTDRFLAILSVIVQAAFSFQGMDAASETENPRRNIAKAVRRVFYRIILFYVLGILIIGMCVSSDDPGLLQDTGNAAESPFVIAINRAGIKVLPHIINACVFTSAFSAGNSYLFCASRVLYGLALRGQAPRFLAYCTKNGLPIAAVTASSAFAFLSFMNVSSGSETVFNWFVSLSTVAGFFLWWSINITYTRFNRAMKVQGYDLTANVYHNRLQPYLAYWGIFWTTIFILINGFEVFFDFQADTFVTAYINIPIFFALFLGYKIIGRTRFWRAHEMDLWTGVPSIEETESPEVPPTTVSGKIAAFLF
ncbi:hypothetical protein EYR36_009332 [Pleurotus pulmonarius]|nr:hypothetical protein EYR36_009332 [Pleurotus pulmonarius]